MVKTTTEPGNVFTAIAAVSAALSKDGIAKDRKNQQQGYTFRGIDDVLNALSPLLAENKLVIIPTVMSRETMERQTKAGGVLFYTVVQVAYTLLGEDGSSVQAVVYGEAMDSGDKSTNKAMSAAYKYMAIQTLCIPIVGDDDADFTTHNVLPAGVQAKDLPKKAPAPKDQPIPVSAMKSLDTANGLDELRDLCGTFKDQALGEGWIVALNTFFRDRSATIKGLTDEVMGG